VRMGWGAGWEGGGGGGRGEEEERGGKADRPENAPSCGL